MWKAFRSLSVADGLGTAFGIDGGGGSDEPPSHDQGDLPSTPRTIRHRTITAIKDSRCPGPARCSRWHAGRDATARDGSPYASGRRHAIKGQTGPADCLRTKWVIPVRALGSVPSWGGGEQAEGAGTLDGLPAPVHAELGVQVADVRLTAPESNGANGAGRSRPAAAKA